MTREEIIEHMKLMGQNAAKMDEVMMYVMTRKDCEVVMAAAELLEAQEHQTTTPEAEWLLFKGKRGATCSYCKRTFYDVYDVENFDYYCRHCGARMKNLRTVKW